MQTHEYLTLELGLHETGSAMEARINEAAEKGWRLSSVFSRNGWPVVLMERPVQAVIVEEVAPHGKGVQSQQRAKRKAVTE